MGVDGDQPNMVLAKCLNSRRYGNGGGGGAPPSCLLYQQQAMYCNDIVLCLFFVDIGMLLNSSQRKTVN